MAIRVYVFLNQHSMLVMREEIRADMSVLTLVMTRTPAVKKVSNMYTVQGNSQARTSCSGGGVACSLRGVVNTVAHRGVVHGVALRAPLFTVALRAPRSFVGLCIGLRCALPGPSRGCAWDRASHSLVYGRAARSRGFAGYAWGRASRSLGFAPEY
jgi:hypothetical protein